MSDRTSRLFPKPRAAFEAEYRIHCNTNNLKLVWYFSLLACIVFAFHLIHHFRLGMEAFSTEMMPYTLLYGFSIAYPALNMLLLHKLKTVSPLEPVANFIELLFPFFMCAVAVMLSVLSAQFELGITPFAILLMVISFTLQGHFFLLASVVIGGFVALSIGLVSTLPEEVYSPLIAIGFTTSLACIVIANMTEALRVNQFEIVTDLNNTNRQLKLLSQQDHLTGLLNRRSIDAMLQQELSRSERFDHPLSLLMIDIDNFKHINDAFGHVYGDKMIKEVASSIKLHVRDVDHVGRIGGDEFVVMLVETDHNYAIQVADRMRHEVSKLLAEHAKDKVTISIGHAVYEGESYIALIEKADRALYRAKSAGKNKVRTEHS